MYGTFFFFFEIYIKFPTFWYIQLYKRANRKLRKYCHKMTLQFPRFSPRRARPPGKKRFFHKFKKIFKNCLTHLWLVSK